MKKILIHGKYAQDDHPRQRQKTEEERKFPKHDSSKRREDYFTDENRPVGHHMQSLQVERRARDTQSMRNCDYKKSSCRTNPTSENLDFNEGNKDTKHAATTGNYKMYHSRSSITPLHPNNTYPSSMNPTFKQDFPETTDTRIAFKKKLNPVNGVKDESFNTERSHNKISANVRNPSTNTTHFEDKSSSFLPPKYSTPPYESNQLLQYYNKQNNDQLIHDLSKNNVYVREEIENCHSYNNATYNNSPKVSINNVSSYESMGFNALNLKDLLYYNVSLMQDQQFFEYASTVKCKILKKIDVFQQPERDELEFLCEITDTDQSEKNQRLITTRTCLIVRNILEKFPLLLNDLEMPQSSQIVYNVAPNLHDTTNNYCCNYESPVLQMVQNSTMLLAAAKDYNLMSENNIAQNGTYVHPESNPNSFDIHGLNDFRENCEILNFNTNNAKKNNPVNSLITGEIKDTAFSENCLPPDVKSEDCCQPNVNSEDRASVDIFSFDEENSTFIVFGLDNLLKYDVNAMHGDMVFDYGFSMKHRILEKIHQFKNPYKDKLELLCELTDGTQREQNQKLINDHMCYLITTAYENEAVYVNNRNFSGKQTRNLDGNRSCYIDTRR